MTRGKYKWKQNDKWGYVSGESKKPVLLEGNESSRKVGETWNKADGKAKSDIIWSVNPTELKLAIRRGKFG